MSNTRNATSVVRRCAGTLLGEWSIPLTFSSPAVPSQVHDVETEAGLVLKVDVRDSWHHRLLAVGEPLQLGFPASVVLTLPDE